MHSSWAKLRRAFLAPSLRLQQQRQKQILSGPQKALKPMQLRPDSRKASTNGSTESLSPTALRYRKFVKSLKHSFSSRSAKTRQQALGKSPCLFKQHRQQTSTRERVLPLLQSLVEERNLRSKGFALHACVAGCTLHGWSYIQYYMQKQVNGHLGKRLRRLSRCSGQRPASSHAALR